LSTATVEAGILQVTEEIAVDWPGDHLYNFLYPIKSKPLENEGL
jgi:hypothetical protein